MDRALTVKNVDVKVDYAEIIRIVSGLEIKRLLQELIAMLSTHQLEGLKIDGNIRDKMKTISFEFYVARVNEYRKSLKLRKLFGFMSAEKIERKANNLALEDLTQLTDIMTGATEKIASFRPGRVAIEQATQQLINLIRNNGNHDINRMLARGEEYEIR